MVVELVVLIGLLVVSSFVGGLAGAVIGAALALGWLTIAATLVERRPILETGLVRAHALRDLLLGLVGGAALIASVVLVLAAAGWYRVEATSVDALGALAASFIGFLASATVEEVLARAIIFRSLERAFGSYLALGVSAVAFGALHLANPNASLVGAIVIALTAGIILAGVYVLTRSLWPVIGVHWGWNIFEGPVFGLPISGTAPPTRLLQGALDGPELWTGGAFGPEASVIAALIGFTAGAAIVVLAARRGRLVAPAWIATAR